MERLCFGFLALAVFSTFAFARTEQEKSQMSGLTVSRIVICEGIKDREPVAADSVFVGVEKLYCYTEIKGAEEPTHIQHVWYRGEKELVRIKLSVRAARWRTYSSKKILPEWTGDWMVEILDAEERRISQISFKVK